MEKMGTRDTQSLLPRVTRQQKSAEREREREIGCFFFSSFLSFLLFSPPPPLPLFTNTRSNGDIRNRVSTRLFIREHVVSLSSAKQTAVYDRRSSSGTSINYRFYAVCLSFQTSEYPSIGR